MKEVYIAYRLDYITIDRISYKLLLPIFDVDGEFNTEKEAIEAVLDIIETHDNIVIQKEYKL